MNSTVIVFPGSNCDRDIAVALEKLNFKNKMVWHKDTVLPKSDLIVIPGGFSYGDYLRSGAMAAKSNILKEVVRFANNGCLILGVCEKVVLQKKTIDIRQYDLSFDNFRNSNLSIYQLVPVLPNPPEDLFVVFNSTEFSQLALIIDVKTR